VRCWLKIFASDGSKVSRGLAALTGPTSMRAARTSAAAIEGARRVCQAPRRATPDHGACSRSTSASDPDRRACERGALLDDGRAVHPSHALDGDAQVAVGGCDHSRGVEPLRLKQGGDALRARPRTSSRRDDSQDHDSYAVGGDDPKNIVSRNRASARLIAEGLSRKRRAARATLPSVSSTSSATSGLRSGRDMPRLYQSGAP